MDGSDMFKVIHATPLFAAKRRENKARQRGPLEGSKTVVEGSMQSSDPRVVYLRVWRHATNKELRKFNPGIDQIPRERIDPRLRYFARLLDKGGRIDAHEN